MFVIASMLQTNSRYERKSSLIPSNFWWFGSIRVHV